MLFSDFPIEIKCQIFSFLSFKDKMQESRVSSEWNELLNDKLDWKKIFHQLGRKSKNKITKEIVNNRIVELKKNTQSANNATAIKAHIFLSRLNISSLEKANEHIKSSNDQDIKSSTDQEILELFLRECIKNNQLDLAQKNLDLMQPGLYKNGYALEVSKKIFKIGNFDNAINLIKHFSTHMIADVEEPCRLFIWEAIKADKIEFAISALAKFKLTSKNEVLNACVKDLSHYLHDKGEIKRYEELQSLYPEAFEISNPFEEIIHYMKTDRFQKALDITISISKDLKESISNEEPLVITESNVNEIKEAELVLNEMLKFYIKQKKKEEQSIVQKILECIETGIDNLTGIIQK